MLERTYHYKKSRSYTKKNGTVSFYDKKVKYKPHPVIETTHSGMAYIYLKLQWRKDGYGFSISPYAVIKKDEGSNYMTKMKNSGIRTDKGGKHLKVNSSFSMEERQLINDLTNDMKFGKKLHEIINHIKTNGMYTAGAMLEESVNLERNNPSEKEKQVMSLTWEARHKAHDTILDNYEKFLTSYLNNSNIPDHDVVISDTTSEEPEDVIAKNDDPLDDSVFTVEEKENRTQIKAYLNQLSNRRKEEHIAYMKGFKHGLSKHNSE